MDDFNKIIEEKLSYINDCRVKKAMLYSILAGGKRIRPKFLYAVVNGYGKDIIDVDNLAVSIEMIHTYSLIHDDLPAMDNDVIRRGRNTCHIEFDEATAILAGDALLTEAFTVASKANINPSQLIKCINLLSSLAGANGMIYGQELDMNAQNLSSNFEDLKKIHNHKTGALISLPLQIGCVLCNKEEKLSFFEQLGYRIGLAFQVQDDILDVTSTSETLGKSNSDLDNDKVTSVSILGLDNAIKFMNDLYKGILIDLDNLDDFDPSYLKALIEELNFRKM